MKLSLVALCLVCVLALCSARLGLSKEGREDDKDKSALAKINWIELIAKLKSLGNKKPGDGHNKEKPDGGEDKDGEENVQGNERKPKTDEKDGEKEDNDDDDDDDDEETVKSLIEQLRRVNEKKTSSGDKKGDANGGARDNHGDDGKEGKEGKEGRNGKKAGDKDDDEEKKASLKYSPVTPKLLHNATKALLEAWPRVLEIFDAADKETLELLYSTDTTKNDTIEALGELLKSLHDTSGASLNAYLHLKYLLNKMVTSGFSWEVHNYRLFHLIFVVSAEIHKAGGKMPAGEAYVRAFHADVQGIRDDIKWLTEELFSEVPELEEGKLPRPVEVVKQVAAIDYMTDKIWREVGALTHSVYALYVYLPTTDEATTEAGTAKPTAPPAKERVLLELRSLLEELSALKRSHSGDVANALEKANKKEGFHSLKD